MKKFGLMIIAGLMIMGFLIYKIGFSKIIDTFKNFNLWFLLIIIPILIIPHILAGVNTWVLTRPYKKVPLSRLIKYSFFILFYSTFTPGKIADSFIIFYLKRNKINVSKSTIIILFDKTISLILKSILGILGILFILEKFNFLIISIPFIMIGGVITLFLLIKSKKFRGLITKFILRKYAKIFKGFSKYLKKYLKNNKKALLYNFLVTCIKIIFETALLYLLFLSFGQSTNFISVLLIFSLLSIIGFVLFPVGISGLGIKEGLGVIMYSTISVDPAIVFNSYIVKLLIIYLINFITFIFYSSEMNLIKMDKIFKKTVVISK